MKENFELRFLEELQASEELYTPFHWIEEEGRYGKLTAKSEEIALKHLKPREEGSLMFKKEDVQGLFKGWGMLIW
ncbi:hypothetical protein GCM10011416_24230 [Polaribacter pacificus]|uniref:Uncharacterized protein n=2 Tax=Flavobacteriaceae TaxID=49546 RepID=A0A917MFL1_9FLAO|nr:hypothetical protein [Polaribacter pacificus]GGH04307.1 hypothetical protein GCM10011416_24230 [Polaribacter pacificus]